MKGRKRDEAGREGREMMQGREEKRRGRKGRKRDDAGRGGKEMRQEGGGKEMRQEGEEKR